MFVRVKTSNNDATTFVQIVQSVRKGDRVTQKIVRHIGVAKDSEELRKLKLLAESIKLKLEAGGQEFLFKPEEIVKLSDSGKKYPDSDYIVNVKNLTEEQRLVSGIHDVYGKLFYDLGYDNVIARPSRNKATANIFKNIVLARVANPVSKMATVDMLEEDFGVTLDLDRVYRMMDGLDDDAIERLKNITYQNSLNLLGAKIDVIFYDATTIYFESFCQDSLKRNGFSKDHKHNQPQVLLALMVTTDGLPVDYEIFAGDIYEGHTLIPALNKIRKKYDIEKIVFVADSAMLSEDNIKMLEKLKEHNISYIVGARLKNMAAHLKEKILDGRNYKKIKAGYSIAEIPNGDRKIIVSYSESRAAKDANDRKRAIVKLIKKLNRSKSAKSHLSNHGYRKYLKIEGKSKLSLDEAKIASDAKWDGLHGVVTNSDLTPVDVLSKYNDLWNVEAAFRVTKHDLAVRPVYHWKPRRIKAHIAICFAAYALVKHLEYRVRLQYKKLSIEKIRYSLMKVQTSILFDRQKRIRYGLPSRMKRDARKIYNILDIGRSITPYIIEKCKM
ncbi:MAG TPA: IS1634 family transposase [candidate division WWE3 bacterium]|uniref:IS1634 family transposase n=1 Tax=candidate division WWE3 bacterium TaxID=2053526 RepID=A0A7C1DP65_UNCKA|nr:IS1634 family transposase [candidate division WWE3 bacterium]